MAQIVFSPWNFLASRTYDSKLVVNRSLVICGKHLVGVKERKNF
jgi:hypothetical protein